MAEFWKENPDLKQQVFDMWNSGDSYKVIALAFSVTRNAIAGLIKRNPHLVSRIRQRGVYPVSKPRESKPNPPKVIKPAQLAGRLIVKPKLAIPKKVEEPDPGFGTVSISELKHGSCRWVYPNKLFCGKPKERGAYCAHHGAMVYIKPDSNYRRKGGFIWISKPPKNVTHTTANTQNTSQ